MQPTTGDILYRIASLIMDVINDVNAYGYITTAIELTNTARVWEAGFAWFLGLYTLSGMFLPFLAYAVTCSRLIKDKKTKWIYIIMSILPAPFIGIIR